MVKKIVLTGGPGSGKTTVLDELVNNYKNKGYKVIVVPETATEIITSGISPVDGTVSMLDFQELVLLSQLSKEKIVNRTLLFTQEENIIIFYDRGTLDGLAYVNEDGFEKVLQGLKFDGINSNVLKLLSAYDLVIDLVGSKDFYTRENNKARSEDPDKAMEVGKSTLKAWLGHNKLKIVLPKEKVEDKTNEVIRIIDESLKEVQVKEQRKFAIDLSKTDLVKIQREGRAIKFLQTYIDMCCANLERRLRKITYKGFTTYSLSTFEIDELGNKTIIEDEFIAKERYDCLLGENRLIEKYAVTKVRYYFTYNGQCFTLDVFDNMGEIGILEINARADEMIKLPDFVEVLEDVTHNKDFLNKNIARADRMELKKI